MFSFLLALAFQAGPFYEQKEDYVAVRPLVGVEEETLDVLWPVFTSHKDWWRFCYIVNYQEYPEDSGYQFSILPIWFNGYDGEKGSYAGLFPVFGHHPHILMMHDERILHLLTRPSILIVGKNSGAVRGSGSHQQCQSYRVRDVLSLLVLRLDGIIIESNKLC